MDHLFHGPLILSVEFVFSETGRHATFLLEFWIVVGFGGKTDCVHVTWQLEILAHKEKSKIVVNLRGQKRGCCCCSYCCWCFYCVFAVVVAFTVEFAFLLSLRLKGERNSYFWLPQPIVTLLSAVVTKPLTPKAVTRYGRPLC